MTVGFFSSSGFIVCLSRLERLAATKGVKVTRRELLRVNVKKTCVDILNYIMAQVPPPQQNLPKPRFSLYLSSQLQYGVVVVYHRQCGFLLDEIQITIDRFLRSKRCVPIDFIESDRLALDLADNLQMMQQAEGAQDPFFGLMESHQLPSPYKVNQTSLMIEDFSPDLSAMLSSNGASDTEGFRSPPASITLREKEPVVVGSAERFEGADLPEATNQELDLLMEEQDQFRQDLDEQMGANRSQDLVSLRESVLGAHRDSVWLQDESGQMMMDLSKAPLPQERTPPRVDLPPSPDTAEEEFHVGCTHLKVTHELLQSFRKQHELIEAIVRPARKLRKRQLIFADPEVQISDQEMKIQIENPQTETLNLSDVLVNLESVKFSAPGQLFSAPCGKLVHSDIRSVWKSGAVLTSFTRPEEDEDEVETLMPETKRRRTSTLREMSSDSGLQPVDASSTKEDGSVGDVITPVGRWSPHEELQPVMEPIAEENIEMPEEQSSGTMRWIWSHLQSSGNVTFDSLLPPKANRRTAAHTLSGLLELLSAGRVKAQQAEPFHQILITVTNM